MVSDEVPGIRTRAITIKLSSQPRALTIRVRTHNRKATVKTASGRKVNVAARISGTRVWVSFSDILEGLICCKLEGSFPIGIGYWTTNLCGCRKLIFTIGSARSEIYHHILRRHGSVTGACGRAYLAMQWQSTCRKASRGFVEL